MMEALSWEEFPELIFIIGTDEYKALRDDHSDSALCFIKFAQESYRSTGPGSLKKNISDGAVFWHDLLISNLKKEDEKKMKAPLSPDLTLRSTLLSLKEAIAQRHAAVYAKLELALDELKLAP